MATYLKVKSYAKINLGLWINDRLSNGYHTLQSVFMLINWHDELTLQPASTFSFEIDERQKNELPTDENNICVKAVRLFQKEINYSAGVQIYLKKTIPIGAGLGGGSSNAAAVLLALNRLFDTKLSLEKLADMGAKLGADVPFFIHQVPLAIVEGIGEKITPVHNIFPYTVVVVFPNESVSTQWAYQHHNVLLPKKAKPETFLQTICEGSIINELENDFEPSVLSVFPKIKELKTLFYNMGAEVSLLSGSGGAVFGVFKDNNKADACYMALSNMYPAAKSEPSFYLEKI